MFSLFRFVPSISIRDFSAALTAKRKLLMSGRPLNTGVGIFEMPPMSH